MKINDGDLLELRMAHAHGSRTFNEKAKHAPAREERDWVSIQIAARGRHRGVPERVLFEAEMPVDELGQFVVGQSAHAEVHWSLDDRRRRGRK